MCDPVLAGGTGRDQVWIEVRRPDSTCGNLHWMRAERWREAMRRALYAPGTGFFVRAQPAEHFRTSAHASPLFAGALARLLERVDGALGHPAVLDVVDVGA